MERERDRVPSSLTASTNLQATERICITTHFKNPITEMSSLVFVFNSMAVVLLFFIISLQGSTGLPVGEPLNLTNASNVTNASSNELNNNSTEEASNLITTIDCTLPAAITTDTEGLRSGHSVLLKYLDEVPRKTELCDLPFNYMSIIGEIHETAINDISLAHVAKMYHVLASFNNYFSHIEDSVSGEEEILLLSTTQSLLDGLQQSYLSVLQDKTCNCSSDCSIPSSVIPPSTITCNNLINNAHYYLRFIVKYSATRTLNDYETNCNCRMAGGVTEREWFEANFPKGNPDLYSRLDKLI